MSGKSRLGQCRRSKRGAAVEVAMLTALAFTTNFRARAHSRRLVVKVTARIDPGETR